MYMYMYIYIYTRIYVYIYIYVYYTSEFSYFFHCPHLPICVYLIFWGKP